MVSVVVGLSLLLALVAADQSLSACDSAGASSGACAASKFSGASREHLLLQTRHVATLEAHDGQPGDEVKRPLKGIATILSDLRESEADAAQGAFLYSHYEMSKVRKVLDSVIDELKGDVSRMRAAALVHLNQAKVTLEHAVEHGARREHVDKDLSHVLMNLEHAREVLKRPGAKFALTGQHLTRYIQNSLTDLQVSDEDNKGGKFLRLNLKHALKDTQYILTYLHQMEGPPDDVSISLKKAVLHLQQALNEVDEGKSTDVTKSVNEVTLHLEDAKVQVGRAFSDAAK